MSNVLFLGGTLDRKSIKWAERWWVQFSSALNPCTSDDVAPALWLLCLPPLPRPAFDDLTDLSTQAPGTGGGEGLLPAHPGGSSSGAAPRGGEWLLPLLLKDCMQAT